MISIIVPCYNAEKFIQKNLGSLLNQTNHNFEVIYVNDGSIDNTESFLKEFSKKFESISYVSICNSGAMRAREVGVSYAKYNYVTFLDVDDILDRYFVEKFINFINTNGYDIVVSNFNIGDESSITPKCNVVQNIYSQNDFLENLCIKAGWELCGKVYNKKLFDNIIYPSKITIGEDAVVFLQLVLNSKSIKVIDEYLYTYIQYSSSASHTKSLNHCRDGLKAAFFIKDLLQKRTNLEKKFIDALILNFFCNSLRRGILKRSDIYFLLLRKSINLKSLFLLSWSKRLVIILGFLLMGLNF